MRTPLAPRGPAQTGPPPTLPPGPGRFKSAAAGLVLATLATLALSALGLWDLPAVACGFHASYFNTYNFKARWEELKPQIQVERSKRAGGIADLVILELLRILKYVDPYNSAPDSPPWMHSEEGRTMARESAASILQQIGEPALPALLEALADAVRFQGAQTGKAFQAVAAARNRREEAYAKLSKEAQRFPALQARMKEPAPTPLETQLRQAWLEIQRTLPVEQQGGGQKALPPRTPEVHRPIPLDWYQQLFQRIALDDPLPAWIAQDPVAAQDARIRTLLGEYQAAADQLWHATAQYNQSLLPGRRNQAVEGLDLVPCEAYLDDLKAVLIRIGKPALPGLGRLRSSNNRQLAETAGQLIKGIQAQIEPPAPVPLQGESGARARALALLALELWDYGDSRAGSRIPLFAEKKLRARGESAIPDIVVLLGIGALKLEAECLKGLRLLSGENLGPHPAAWQRWLKEREERATLEALAEVLKDFEGKLTIGLTREAEQARKAEQTDRERGGQEGAAGTPRGWVPGQTPGKADKAAETGPEQKKEDPPKAPRVVPEEED